MATPSPPRTLQRIASGVSFSQTDTDSSQHSSSTSSRAVTQSDFTEARLPEFFRNIIGKTFRHPGTDTVNLRDSGIYICTKLGLSHGKPAVFTRLTSLAHQPNGEEQLIDLRDVLNYMDNDLQAPYKVYQRFSAPRLLKQFNQVMNRLERTESPSSMPVAAAASTRPNPNGHIENTQATPATPLPDLQTLLVTNTPEEEPAADIANQENINNRIYRPPPYHENTCIMDIPIRDIGILISLYPTMKQISKGRRSPYKHLLTQALHRIQEDPNNEQAHKAYILLPMAIFSKKADNNLSPQQCMLHIQEDNWAPFTLSAFAKPCLPEVGTNVSDAQRAKVAEGYLQLGGIAKAYAVATRPPPEITFPPEEILNFFAELHPIKDYQIPPMTAQTSGRAMHIDCDQVLTAIRQSKPLKAPGISSLRYDHLRQLVAGEIFGEASDFLEAFTFLINSIATASVPPLLATFLYETKGIGIGKANGALRPLGMRDVHTNLASRILHKELKDDIVATFKDSNFALNGPKGIDKAIAHVMHWLSLNPHHDLFFLDGVAAFQNIRRDVALASAFANVPSLAPLLHSIHEKCSKIWLQSEDATPCAVITETGTTQGCGTGMTVHGFGTKVLYDNLQSTAFEADEPAFFIAYADDPSGGGTTPSCVELIEQYIQEGPACGTFMNTTKTVILMGKKDNDELQHCIDQYLSLDIPRDQILVHPDNGGDPLLYGTKYLGVPIGSDEFIRNHLAGHLAKYEQEAEMLMKVEKPQQRWIFLYYCFARKPTFILRHILPSLCTAFCDGFDVLLKRVFQSMLSVPLTDTQWKQVKMPIRFGGCGLPGTAHVAAASFVANAKETAEYLLRRVPDVRPLIDPDVTDEDTGHRYPAELTLHLAQIKREFIDQVYGTDDEAEKLLMWDSKIAQHLDERNLQYFFTTVLTKTAKSEIIQELSVPGAEADHARFVSVAQPHTGDFLLTIPKDKSSELNTLEFANALRLRIGCDIPNMPRNCNCGRRPALDKKGVHVTSCAKGGHLIMNHNAVQRDLQVLATSAGFPASALNKDVLLHNNVEPDVNKKGDLLIAGMGDPATGRALLIDVTITHPACPSVCAATIANAKASIQRAETRKNNKYLALAANNDITFTPMALECYGAFSDDFIRIVNRLCLARAEILEIDETIVQQYWYRRLSCTIQRGNSRALSRRCLDITQSISLQHDAYYDDAIDLEYSNVDTMPVDTMPLYR